MIVNLPTIQSNVDSSLCQMIIPKTFYDNGWIYNFFCKLHYDKEVGAVTFENYNTFMNKGVLLKRYFEYPWKPDTDLNEVFRFLVLYLKKGYLIVNYLEDFTYDERNYKPCLLFYDYDESAGQLKFFCWSYDNQIQSFSMTIEELFADIQKAKSLFQALEEKDVLVTLLEESKNNDLQVLIGSENTVQSMQDCSVITATYKMGDNTRGTIGIVGPTRMDYSQVISVLNGMVQNIEKVLKNLSDGDKNT